MHGTTIKVIHMWLSVIQQFVLFVPESDAGRGRFEHKRRLYLFVSNHQFEQLSTLRRICGTFSKRVNFHVPSNLVRHITLPTYIQRYSLLCHQQRSYAREFFLCCKPIFHRQLCVRSDSILPSYLHVFFSNDLRNGRSRPFKQMSIATSIFPPFLRYHSSCSNSVIVPLLILSKEYQLWNLFV